MKQLSKVEIGKMRQLADFLETVPVKDFDLSVWVQELEQPPTTYLFGLIQTDPGCGFAGCAMGWAAHSELFDGLHLEGWLIKYKGYTDLEATMKVFGITKRAVDYLFTTWFYKTKFETEPGHVADRLNRFADIVEARLKRAMYVKPEIVKSNVVEFRAA